MDDLDLVPKRLGDNLDQIESLNLTNRGLKELPPFIASLTHLKFLYLDNNRLIFVPEIGKLVLLEEISIENNELTLIPEAFNHLRNLKLLNLSKNHLKCLNSSLFCGLSNLTTLWLNNCELMYLPKEIGSLKYLEKFGIKNNSLQDLPDEIGLLPKLQWLNIEKNELLYLPRQFDLLKSLNYLNLSRNKLENVPAQLFQLSNLNVLVISHNCIKSIKDDDIMGLSAMQKVDLRENPFLENIKTNQPELYKQLFSINNFVINNDETK